MASDQSDSSLASSLTDLMTSLAIIFVLLLVASLNDFKQEGEMKRNDILKLLREALQKELKDYQVEGFEVKTDPRDPLGLIVIVPEGLLNFPLNSAEIPQAGAEFLGEIIPKMAETLCSEEFRNDINSIIVEGHTDTTGTDEINLPLSQNRSLSVVKKSLNVLDSASALKGGVDSIKTYFLGLLAATGRGSADPYDSSGSVDLARNRRVVFKIRVRSLEQRMFNPLAGTQVKASR